MGSASQRGFEHLPPRQQQSLLYYQTIARGPFREKTTNATFAALADVKCSSVCITNTSGYAVGVRRGGSGVVITIPDGTGKVFDVVDNAQELQVKNATANVNMTVQYECGGEAI